MANIEIHGAERGLPGKGHDRFVKDDDRLFAAVFDGAGGAELSDAIAENMSAVLRRHDDVRQRSTTDHMVRIVHDLDSLPEGAKRKATAAMVTIAIGETRVVATYANAGDSSIYFYDHEDDRLQRLAHTPTSFIRVGGRLYISTEEFLGHTRTIDSLRRLIGTATMHQKDIWSIIGMSDGVIDDDGRGITQPELAEILQTTHPARVPEAVLGSFEAFDDASLFVISNNT